MGHDAAFVTGQRREGQPLYRPRRHRRKRPGSRRFAGIRLPNTPFLPVSTPAFIQIQFGDVGHPASRVNGELGRYRLALPVLVGSVPSGRPLFPKFRLRSLPA